MSLFKQAQQQLKTLYTAQIEEARWEVDALNSVMSTLSAHNYSANDTLRNLHGVVEALHHATLFKISDLETKVRTL